MWMLRPSVEPREVTIDLPPLLVESLGVGAEMLANYLNSLTEFAANDPARHPPPMPILCRICEVQIIPWWFEKHTELCMQEHRAEMDVQMAQDNLNEQRNAIVRVLDALEARKGRPLSGEGKSSPGPQAEYKGLPIGSSSTPSSGAISSAGSSAGTPPRSREGSLSGFGHSRAKSFAVRRPLARIVELVLDLCDTAAEINTPALKETRNEHDEPRTQSPQSESRIAQVLQWQSPSSNTLEHEQGLAALVADTEKVARAKVEAVTRHRRILEYGERIRVEFMLLVEDCISAAMAKAERIAAGELSDTSSGSSSCSETGPEQEIADETAVAEKELRSITASPASLSDKPSSITAALRSMADRANLPGLDRRPSSNAVSTRSNSPLESPTPKSLKSATGLLSSQLSKRASLFMENDGAESDSGVPPSILSVAARTESPSSDSGGLQRGSGSRDRKRRSLILPGLSSSPHRQQSPARNTAPQSPLRMRPRVPSGSENHSSPATSPLLTSGELFMSNSFSQGSALHSAHHHAHHHPHHRRQSSATSSEVLKPPVSPRLTSVGHQPRAVPTSIKDFEIIKPISKGAFGSVYLSKKKTTGEYFAIKVLKKADMVAKNQVTNVKAERAIMMWQGESDFVAKLYWTFSSKDYLFLVMEYLNGGDCASLVKILGGLPEDWTKKYIAEVILGVEHLHSRGIVHRDLKPDNLLIDQKGHLKLTDFGLSRMGLVGRQKRVLKSPNEQAPDLLKHGPFAHTTSLASSRSASFDFQGTQSPNSTPLVTPDPGTLLSQPSYFNLNREASQSREQLKRTSGYRSDSGGSEAMNTMFRTFSIHDSPELTASTSRTAAIEEETNSEGSDSPHLFPLASMTSSVSNSSHLPHSPPDKTMPPPPMALFDPEDHNRRFVGTPDYLAPETINGSGQDEMSDWWSLGCIMFEFFYGYPPFHAPTPDEVFENILKRNIHWPDEDEDTVSPDARDLMNRLMIINPRDRIGANLNEEYPSGGAEIQAHPWFSDINWDSLLEDEAQFVPAPENPEDTEYFDARGATLQAFTEELEDQVSPGTPSGDPVERPHDALSRVRSQVNSMKRGLMPLHIPPHVRDTRSRRLSEPVAADDFGSFNFKNLPVLEKANKDVIQKLRAEALQAQAAKTPSSGNPPLATSPGPSLEGSPLLPMPLQRTMSANKGNNRPASPSGLVQQSNSSPNRPSQPSSPLLVQFSTGQNQERRKTSGSSSSSSLQPASVLDGVRMSSSLKTSSTAPSPIRTTRLPATSVVTASPDRVGHVKTGSMSSPRARSHTVGSQESDQPPSHSLVGHHKRRSQLLDISPSSSDNEDPRAKALLKVQRRRQSSRRLSQITLADGPIFRPLDVLICEDHPVSKWVMERLLEKLRCRTITATNGSEATRYALSDVQFDIILMEFRLPQINGADVARMIRETKSANTTTPIVCVTGYLKDLPENHNFDYLIEKQPTIEKLTEALCKFCQWKPPPKDLKMNPYSSGPSSAGMSHIVRRPDDSPSSTASSFAPFPGSSYRGSSREDSIGSSWFGDNESTKTEDLPVIISRQPTSDWDPGLGISEGALASDGKPLIQTGFPQLTHTISAPPDIATEAEIPGPRRQRSSEVIQAKRNDLARKRHECAESGDDEDEELGQVQPRLRSPGLRGGANNGTRKSSKLGIEMMRTNSRGSIVSGTGEAIRQGGVPNSPAVSLEERLNDLSLGSSALDTLSEGKVVESNTSRGGSPAIYSSGGSSATQTPPSRTPARILAVDSLNRDALAAGPGSSLTSPNQGHITPPIIFPRQPGDTTKDIVEVSTPAEEAEDPGATPRPLHTAEMGDLDPDPTPRASLAPGRTSSADILPKR